MPAGPSPTILVAEDNGSDQLLLRRAVAKTGLNVHLEFVSSGLEAVEYLKSANRRHRPALLLLDLRMPHMDGFEVLEWLRENPTQRPAYVVVLTSCCGERDVGRAGQLGVDHYLVKPHDPVELAAAIKRLEPYWTDLPPLPEDPLPEDPPPEDPPPEPPPEPELLSEPASALSPREYAVSACKT